MRKLKVGLALGGGGARGLSHIGVLKVLVQKKIPIDIITGTSMGAVIGALYALNPDVYLLEEKTIKIINSDMFKKLNIEFLQNEEEKTFMKRFKAHLRQTYLYSLTKTRLSLISQEKIEEVINELLPDKNIIETKIPFAAVATDLTRAEEVVFREGPLRKLVQASMSIEGIFPPLNWGKSWLIDGGVISIVPIKAAFDMGADLVIGVDVKSRMRYRSTVNNGFEVITRANYIRGIIINAMLLKQADIIISPGVKNIHWADFKKIRWLIKKGEQACASKIPEIKDKIAQKKTSTFLKRMFSREQA